MLIWEGEDTCPVSLLAALSAIHFLTTKIKRIQFMVKLRMNLIRSAVVHLDLWYSDNETISNLMDSYYKQIMRTIDAENSSVSKDLIKSMKYLYDNGNASEKAQVITLLAFLDKWFIDV